MLLLPMSLHETLLPSNRMTVGDAPPMLYKPSHPLACKVLDNQRLTPEDYDEDIRHIVIDLSGTDYAYKEGQSMGILAPGTTKAGKPHPVRLYSIASPAVGEPGYERAVALCVKRVVYNTEDSDNIEGICSNFLCNLRQGDTVLITGPNGKNFSLPEDTETDLLLFGTGTGIAPFRSFLMNLDSRGAYRANVHLFFGSRNRDGHLYANAQRDDLHRHTQHDLFHLHSAFSREDPSRKVYIADLLQEKQGIIEPLLDRKNYAFYICGLRGMEAGIEVFLREYLARRSAQDIDDGQWAGLKEHLRSLGRWVKEVY